MLLVALAKTTGCYDSCLMSNSLPTFNNFLKVCNQEEGERGKKKRINQWKHTR